MGRFVFKEFTYICTTLIIHILTAAAHKSLSEARVSVSYQMPRSGCPEITELKQKIMLDRFSQCPSIASQLPSREHIQRIRIGIAISNSKPKTAATPTCNIGRS